MSENREIFKGKSVEDLYKEIYTNSKSTKSRVNDLIKVMTDKVENTADAIRIMPMIKDYLDVGVKNDEHLIKLAQIIQRSDSNKNVSEQDIYGDLQSLLDNAIETPQLPAPNNFS